MGFIEYCLLRMDAASFLTCVFVCTYFIIISKSTNEDGVDMLFRNVANDLEDYTASEPTLSSPSKPQIS
jgi:hypothetical protein